MAVRGAFVWLCFVVAALACSACGGGAPRSQSADLLAMHQPTPDPTLDAVVRDLPRALAGVPPTPTPTAKPQPAVPVPKLAPAVRQPPAPTAKPAPPKPTVTATHH
jgi:hypothetical protein